MRTLPVASPEEQQIMLKAAEARYRELGIPDEQAAVLFQTQLQKTAEELTNELAKEGQGLINPAGGTFQQLWSNLPEPIRKGLINALIGGGVGGLGGAAYSSALGEDIGEGAGRGAGYGALAGALTPALSSLIEKFSEDNAEASVEEIKQAALARFDELRIPRVDAEAILSNFLAKEACEADKGDKYVNPKGTYPTQVMAGGKPADKGKKKPKKKDIKKMAEMLGAAVKQARATQP